MDSSLCQHALSMASSAHYPRSPSIQWRSFRGIFSSQWHLTPTLNLGFTQFVLKRLRLFASSWKARQNISPENTLTVYTDYEEKFELLSRVLSSRHEENLNMVRGGLKLLFLPIYPMVLLHGDLAETNILVDHNTSHLTGVIDWAEAKICPFGLSLWGLENILATMNSTGWNYHPHQEALRLKFWQTFDEAGGIAKIAGLFHQYGFDWGNGGRDPSKAATVSFMYLDAFCAKEICGT
ncbi:hypothetical protein N7520_011006 [Penicillium odoratum]|uniref:uncharacterized protein n=1 Tax=Penicillium odoratum TaxID=1167516 RepID=UPI0025473EFB|nr:uncharacterized protein N7520_011006 [Penicillium odoratum]KAJ5745824.1 hypothetical protein N7520_011006 [Penicillium odoratum]